MGRLGRGVEGLPTCATLVRCRRAPHVLLPAPTWLPPTHLTPLLHSNLHAALPTPTMPPKKAKKQQQEASNATGG
jgi:hypothetical protein